MDSALARRPLQGALAAIAVFNCTEKELLIQLGDVCVYASTWSTEWGEDEYFCEVAAVE